MSKHFDLILAGGTVHTPAGPAEADLGIAQGKIAAIGSLDPAQAETVWRVEGLDVLPGVIDSQVHFREPGLTHKEDLESGTRSAVKGGVTAVFEMPNTNPNTVSAACIAEKLRLSEGRAWCDHAFYVGGEAENAEEIATLERLPGVCGVKVFMGASTGSLLVADDATLERVLRSGHRRVAIHAEDEPRLQERRGERRTGDPSSHPVWRDPESAILATKRVLRLARAAGRPVHVLHITTADEMPILAANKDICSVEVTPQHLTLAAPDAYERLGTLAQMNPPIRDAHHRAGLWRGLQDGVVDVVGSDHAPHTREEKARDYPDSPAGMPGVQTLVPVLLTHVAEGRLSLQRFIDLTSAGVQRLFNLSAKGRIALGYDADITVVDLKARREITEDWLEYRCGWSPFTGMMATGWPVGTIIRGHIAMREDTLLGAPIGRPCRFMDTLQPDQPA